MQYILENTKVITIKNVSNEKDNSKTTASNSVFFRNHFEKHDGRCRRTANATGRKGKRIRIGVNWPHIWEYIGADGQPETPFTLRMCLPVKETIGETGGFQFAELPEIQAVTTEHKGAWADLKDTYCAFVPEIMQNGLKMTGLTREVYHVVDMENQEKCVTEIQIEVE